MRIAVAISILCCCGFTQPISFTHYNFDPLISSPDIPTELRIDHGAHNNYYLVQFDGPIQEIWKQDIVVHGGIIYDYIPVYAFLVQLPAASVNELKQMPHVRWIGEYHPAYKMNPHIGMMKYNDPVRAHDPWLNLRAELYYDADLAGVTQQLQDIGARVVTVARHDEFRIIRVEFDIAPEMLPMAARIGDIKWIEEVPEYTLYNDVTRWVIQTNVSNDTSLWRHGIDGTGQLLSVMDSGLDYLSCFFRDPEGDPFGNNHRKIQAYYLYGSAQQYDDHGHGTHVSGTTCGNDFTNTYTKFNGVARGARMIMQDIGYGGGNLSPPNPLTIGFQDAEDDGACAQTNSWGYTSGNSYTTECRDIDNYMYNNKYFVILFAAGNSGSASNTVHPPATAKDDITVGASCQNPGHNAIATFSSRGPADDTRYEPTIAISGSDANDVCPDPWSSVRAIASALNSGTTPVASCDTISDNWCGTSMATPAACGATGLVRQYYYDGWYPLGSPDPSNAFTPTNDLIRATIINSAEDMGTANIPNNDEGWGRIVLDNALYFAGDTRELRVAEHDGINTNDSVLYAYIVDNTSEPLEITLVWSDIGAAVSANPALVNDLDLTVTTPSATEYLGNVFSGGQSQTGGSHDRRNTVECVLRNTPETGTYTIKVKGFNIPNGPQHFALCLTGCFAPVGIAEEHPLVPGTSSFSIASLGRNAEIEFTLTARQHVEITAYDVTGRKIATIAHGVFGPCEHKLRWETDRVSAGIYFLVIASQELNTTKKFILVK
jgi:hypothetical protein